MRDDRARLPIPSAVDVSLKRVYSSYFALQAAVGVFFWFVVTGSDEGRRIFDLLPGQPRVTDAFLLADALAIATSIACAWAFEHESRWVVPLAAFTAGCLVYPTLYLVAWAPHSAGAARCLFIMVPPSVISTWIALRAWRDQL
jgi:hypothetical protein